MAHYSLIAPAMWEEPEIEDSRLPRVSDGTIYRRYIISAAIDKAFDNGWRDIRYGEVKPTYIEGASYTDILYGHDFTKALWGEPNSTTLEPGWKFHLSHMVIADNPIKYLGENI